MASANVIEILIKARDDASKVIDDLGNGLDKNSKKASGFGGAMASMGKAVGIAALAIGAAGAVAATAGAAIGFGFNSAVEQAQTKLMAFTKDAGKTATTLAWVKDEAAKTQFSFTEMADAAANLTPVAKSSGVALEDLVKQAEILAAINPTEGLTGATFSLREALTGDWVSIVDRFNLPRQRINELKEQGVPAMKIISQTLGEMGIDYSLVAEQGKTVSARFDQIKDKLVMLAGTATKPIFDRVSEQLGKIGDVDLSGVGENIASFFSGMIQFIDELIPKLQDLGAQVWEYLGPKFSQLAQVIQTDLMPVLVRLWQEVIQPLLPVLGTALVLAIGLVVDALSFFVQAWSRTIDMVTSFISFIISLPTIVGNAINFIVEKVTWLKDHWAEAIGFIIGFVATLPIKLAVLMSQAIGNMINAIISVNWGAIFNSVVNGARGAFDWVVNAGRNALNTLVNLNWGAIFSGAAKGIGNSVIGLIEGAINGALAGIPGKPQVKIPRFATGVENFSGGLAVVGERGPELVSLPRGSSVFTNQQSQEMVGGVTVNFHGPVSVRDDSDIESIAQRVASLMDRGGQLTARGLA